MSSNGYISEVRIFSSNFAPRGFAFCNGQLLAISQNAALFSLLGTTYGGDGQSTFGLPNLQGRVPIHFGQSAGTSNYALGQTGGVESVTLTTSQMPQHSHGFTTFDTKASAKEPTTGAWLARSSDGSSTNAVPQIYVPSGTNVSPVVLNSGTIGVTGGSTAHENRQPYLALNYCIALQGVYPSRN